jgi:hypothetical protein
MNKDRRNALRALVSQLADAVNIGILSEVREEIDSIRDEEQDYFDNMPEGLQSGDKGSVAEAAISAMDAAMDSIDQVIDALADATDSIGEAQG